MNRRPSRSAAVLLSWARLSLASGEVLVLPHTQQALVPFFKWGTGLFVLSATDVPNAVLVLNHPIPTRMLIPPLDISAAGANPREMHSFRKNYQLGETWRAGRNKTANTYVIEIPI